MIPIDRGSDLHTHSTLTDGADSPQRMADAAAAAGLRTWGLSDHVRTTSDWVVDYVRTVRGLRVADLTIRCGVEAKILDTTGALDLPATLPELDYVLVADHQFPSASGPVHPREIARRVDAGELPARAVVDDLIGATAAAVARAPFRPIVVHPFSLLPKMGLSEGDVHDEHLRSLATACRDAGAAIEINEKWRCPSSPVALRLHALGVELVAGTDAHRCADVGRWSYLDEVARDGAFAAAGP
ncbi:PHP domain-containing protein [uncultured Jatrophihabitans sp.]|uniref:PHP domain-containing protein n=1 Tax=uncultured Jatrophihabitans sp. TaxID=1610747 RepID=UPI0035CC08FB